MFCVALYQGNNSPTKLDLETSAIEGKIQTTRPDAILCLIKLQHIIYFMYS